MSADSPMRGDRAIAAPAPAKASGLAVGLAIIVSAAALGVGYAALGALTMLVFTGGFVGGLLLWLAMPARGVWRDIKVPFWMALSLFVLHRVEEKQFGFFVFLSDVTGVPTPRVTSLPVIALVALSVGAWLLVPILTVRPTHSAAISPGPSSHPWASPSWLTSWSSLGSTTLSSLMSPACGRCWFLHPSRDGVWRRLALGPQTTRPTVLSDSASAQSESRQS